jgi:phenylalanyl-tRNA synthetase beta chain
VAWSDAVAVARRLADVLHVELTVEQAATAPFHQGRCAALVLDGTVVGHAGELHPTVLKEHGLPPRSVAGEIDLDALLAASPAIGPRPDFSTYPVAKEDLAFLVDTSVTAESLRAALASAHAAVESVRLFDVYTGAPVPDGQKSLAFAVRLRAPDRTLKDTEIAEARAALVAAGEALGGVLR